MKWERARLIKKFLQRAWAKSFANFDRMRSSKQNQQFCLSPFQSLSEIQGQAKEKGGRKKANASGNVAAKVFSKYDVVETSYHFYSDRIDLHLCDDPGGSKHLR